ncbi:MAG: S-layer homology domain-containing protein, partial [Bacillota bacterium]
MAEIPASIFDGTQSDWAEEELEEAYNLDLTYPGVMNNYRKNITREEFCILAVRLYEALSGNQAMGGVNPFQDTTNQDIVKAYHLGIVKGVSVTEFAPYKDITRQEICVMIHRTLKVALTGIEESYTGEFPFSDQSQIASWAMDSVRFAYGNSIMKGIGNNLIGPLQNTTREQAIVLMKRTYVSFKDGEP